MEKICIITNKRVKKVETYIKNIIPDAHFAYAGLVYDMDFQSLRVRKHENGELYMFGNPLCNGTWYYIDCHEFYEEIQPERFIYMKKRVQNTIQWDDYDRIIVIPEGDFESYLAISSFLKIMGYDPSRRIHCLEMDYSSTKTVEASLSAITDKELPYFETKFAEIYNVRKEEGFVSTFPISRNILYLQSESRMNNTEFADFFGTSVRNVENWRRNPETLKDFIYDLFEYKLLKEGII